MDIHTLFNYSALLFTSPALSGQWKYLSETPDYALYN